MMRMLWHKAWIETRFRTLLPTFMILFMLFQLHVKGLLQITNVRLMASLPVFWLIAPLVLAGCGIYTEAPFRAVMGSEGAMYFTLALPVSRRLLLGMRAAFGMLETGVFIAVVCGMAALAFPEVRASVSLTDGLKYWAAVLVCSTAIYGLSTLFSTFLDQQWQVLATVATTFAVRMLTGDDGFAAMGSSSPVMTHAMPWTAMGISAAFGLVCLAAAVKVVEARQY